MTILPDLDISRLINKFFQTHPEYQLAIESDSVYEPDSDYDTDEASDLNYQCYFVNIYTYIF